jgi:hypothetical protein
MRPHRILSFVLVSTVLTASAQGASGFKFESTVLYQPDEPLRSRLSSAEELAAYIKRLDAACTTFLASETTPERLDIVVGLKPKNKVRVWFVSSRRSSQDKTLLDLRKKLEAVPPCSVHGGPVAFAMRCTIAGAAPSNEVPMPEEWRPKGKEPSLVPDGVFERIWRD